MILVFGSKGLLGSTICELDPKDTIGVSRDDMDVCDTESVWRLMRNTKADTVINCVGHVPRSYSANGSWVNSQFPHILHDFCEDLGMRLIHVSTDCVFNTETADRTEDEQPDSRTTYGLQKAAGEINTPQHLVVRTSFIGLPDPPGRGLLAYLKRNANRRINGWRACLWNGLTTYTLGKLLLDFAYDRNMNGFWHIFGETVNKYELLTMANEIYNFGCSINPVLDPISYRTLATVRTKLAFDIPPIYDQIVEMRQRHYYE
jgi:dTDP-4-dehydrorhamnose reductase